MNDQPDEQEQPSVPDPASSDPGMIQGTYQHQQLSARVPEHVSVGVFSTGAIVLTTNTEFIIDFLIRMARPHQVVARVVLPPGVIPQVIGALSQAIERWQSHFGKMPSIAAPPPSSRKPSLDEVYGDLKLPDTHLSGAYANGVMISFSAAEFSFDFITNFFPRSAVSQRVYLSVPQVPRFMEALQQTMGEFQKRAQANSNRPQTDNTPPPADESPDTSAGSSPTPES